jgi:ADP-heptose:LPS heptosyltransferase
MFNFKETYKLPFKYKVPNYVDKFLSQKNLFSAWIKYLKRYCYIILKRQRKLELFSILPHHNEILWINISAPSFGDSLMDLSSRVLLEGRNIDLFTVEKVAEIFLNDHRFNNVYSNIQDISNRNYSLVIIDSYSSRGIKIKCRIAPTVNFVGMYGYYNGPEVNRVLFSFHKMNKLLGYQKSENEVNSFANASMSISKVDQDLVDQINLPKNYIAIALGGEWSYRTYSHWDKVVEYIFKKNRHVNIVLVGSENALEIAKKLFLQFSDNNLFNCVSRYSFSQTAQIIHQAEMLLCCDGGLMHAANASNITIVALFARLSPKMQLTDSINAFPLFDKEDVNNILVESVIEKYDEAVNFFDSHLQVL